MKQSERYGEFTPRSSLLEARHLAAEQPMLAGFFVTFWLGFACYTIAVLLDGHHKTKGLCGWALFAHLSGVRLKATAALLVLLTTANVLFVFAIAAFRRNAFAKSAVVAAECLFCLGVPLSLCFHDAQLPHWHRLFLSLYSMVLFMKMHAFFDSPDDQPSARSLPDALGDYLYFLVAPTLLFRPRHAYPKTPHIRPAFVVEKLLMTAGCLFSACVVAEDAVHPVVAQRKTLGVAQCVGRLLLPVFLVDFLLFWAFFEGFCNALAEATRFADRRFYDDWWNSGSFAEFARKWNRIVHCFLFCHFYQNLHRRMQIKKTHASLLTFAFSSVLHEVAMGALMGRVRCIVFVLQMLQIPLIRVAKLRFFRAAIPTLVSNAFVMGSLFVGPSLIFVLYL